MLCKVGMPLMFLLAIAVLIRVFTLGTPDPAKPDQSVLNGLGFMWNPQPENLLDPQTWLEASGQISHVRKISQNPVALAAILFVAILLGFVLILVHIAGKRWAAERRFDNLKR